MAKKFLVPIDLNQLELQNASLQNLATAPSNPATGQVYFNTTTNKAMVYDGTNWVPWEVGTSISPATANPAMDGTAAVGTSLKYAREDHVHPSDTTKVDKETGKGLSTNDYTTTEKNKLAGIASGAEVNQNAFSNVKVGSTTVAADGKTDTLELAAGSNVTLTPDATNDKVTIAAADTTYDPGTQSQLETGTDTTDRVWQAKIIHDYIAAELASLPADQFLDLNNTTFVLNFQWSSTLYPGSTNPNLDGKPVLVLALTDGTSDVYSFLDVEDLFNSYTGTSPINVSGQTISHANSGVSAGSKGDTTNQTPTWGGTFKVPSGTVNATGHLTAFADHTVTIPNTEASTSAAGLMSAADKTKLNQMVYISRVDGQTILRPVTGISSESPIALYQEPTQDGETDLYIKLEDGTPITDTMSTTLSAGDTSVTAYYDVDYQHLASWRAWLASSDEEVIVDTENTDDGVDFIIASAIQDDIEITYTITWYVNAY